MQIEKIAPTLSKKRTSMGGSGSGDMPRLNARERNLQLLSQQRIAYNEFFFGQGREEGREK
jgi:hypothetical protein